MNAETINIFVSIFVLTSICPSGRATFTNLFAVEIDGDPEVASGIADKYGFNVLNHFENFGNVYEFSSKNVVGRSKRGAGDLFGQLFSDPRVLWVEQQRILDRSKRGYPLLSDDNHQEVIFNDPFFSKQWYLVNNGQTGGVRGHDMNVAPLWRKGLSGKGVVVTIVDDGIDHFHPDLKPNYDPQASADLNDPNDPLNDPTPNMTDPTNNHGTKCAGTVAAKANNSNCGVGVAFNAKIGGIRMLDGVLTDLTESRALSYNNQHIDIYSSSWGPKDNGMTLDGPRRYTRKALATGAKMGRGGKGSIFVWATGNGGIHDDDCNCDGYVTSIYTLAVGSISDQGKITYYSETCPSTMAVVFTGGSHSSTGGFHHSNNVVTTDSGGKCTLDFGGTSTAAPLLAGCIALLLEANGNLTWRDVQHIVAETSIVPSESEDGWAVNEAGYHVNHKYGFGAIDCQRMVEAAETWEPVQDQHKCVVKSNTESRDLMTGQTIMETLETDGCHGYSFPPFLSTPVDKLEQVQVYINMSHVKRGDVSIDLVAPSGITSKLLKVRPLDTSKNGIDFVFKTVHDWGENPRGNWTLIIRDNSKSLSLTKVGQLNKWSLILYGVEGELSNHRKWSMSDGYLLRDGRMIGTRLELRKRMLEDQQHSAELHRGESSNGNNGVNEPYVSYDNEIALRKFLDRLKSLHRNGFLSNSDKSHHRSRTSIN